MMKIILVIPMMLISFLLSAQGSVNSITYKFFHLIDTTNPNSVRDEEMQVNFDKDGSRYFSYRAVAQQELLAKKMEEAEKTGNYNINLGVVKSVTKEDIYIFPAHKKMFTTRQLKDVEYQIPDLLPDFKWEIKKETKDIQGYKCQLARGYWRGRTYDAWFTTDIPYPVGPWKLNGLPGAILEAADATGTIRFECTQIASIPGIQIELPQGAIITSYKEFEKMEAGMKKVSGQLTSSSVPITITETAPAGSKPVNIKPSQFNNPIELTKQ